MTAAALLALLAGPLVGCGGEPPPPTPAEPQPPTESTTAESPGSAPRRHFSRLADLEQAVAAQVRRHKTAATTTTATVPGESGEPTPLPPADGAVDFGTDGAAAHAYLPMVFDRAAAGLIEAIVLTNDTAYVKAPAGMGLKQPAGKPWTGPIQVAESFKGTAEQKLVVLATKAVRTADPTRGFTTDLFGDGARLVSALDEDLDGVPAVKYSIEVDVAKAAAQQDDPRRKRTLEGYVAQGETGNDITLWVGADDRPLRMSLRGGPAQRPTTVDIRYRDWGRPVRIDEPPAAQTAR